ncbi:LytTR family DNA-binding domain-containing protein [uncultured Parabacteroides sp.]|uniref:LytTR family DNA-binding domain-containing protein n=1 Tax=uncultured Parabacteroides sp. TaxID=512312 RepID=UPI00260FF77F|nr:LytTR family DNA-binding domain-containing protein [uncultured Parabacteroides sp.]
MEQLIFEETFFLYSNKNNMWKVEYNDIVSIECDKPYVRFLLKKSKMIIIKKSLFDVQKNLNEKLFVRINRKTIVNIENVQSVFKNRDVYSLLMQNGLEYVVSIRTVSLVRKCFFLLNSSEKKDKDREDENIQF